MRFQITDVGRIRKADIKLDGITVIAGENNTGKSTVGKALFAYANADGDLERRSCCRDSACNVYYSVRWSVGASSFYASYHRYDGG